MTTAICIIGFFGGPFLIDALITFADWWDQR